jgi:hypothetical protein
MERRKTDFSVLPPTPATGVKIKTRSGVSTSTLTPVSPLKGEMMETII